MSCCAFPGLALSISSLLPISQSTYPPTEKMENWNEPPPFDASPITNIENRPRIHSLVPSLLQSRLGHICHPAPSVYGGHLRFFPMQKKPFPTQGRGWITVIRSRSTDSRERLCFPGKFSSLDKWRREWKKTREEPAKGTVKWPGSGGKTKSAFEIFEKGRRGSSLGYTTEERETVGKWKLEEESRG